MSTPVADAGEETAAEAARWAGRRLSTEQRALLRRYADWLAGEAIPAGALGPDEESRLWPRHIADSLVFAAGWRGQNVATLIDVGSGAGLPGIPLAVVMPATRVTLLDRSGRRAAMLSRAVRILGLTNVLMVEADVSAAQGHHDVVVSRGSLGVVEALKVVARIAPQGIGVLAASRRRRPEEAEWETHAAECGLTVEVITVPPHLLDSPAWLLRMAHRGQRTE